MRETHPVDQRDTAEAASLLRRLLAAVEDDTMEAVGPAAGLVRQMQGAAEALELADNTAQQSNGADSGSRNV